MAFASFMPRLPEIRDRIEVDLATLGLVLTLATVGGLVGSGLSGPAVRRLGTRGAMLAGAIGVIVTLPVIGLVTSPPALLVGLAVLHLFDVIADVSMNLQGSWLSSRRPTPVISRLHGLWSVGTVVGGLGASLAASRLSLQAHLAVVSVVLLLALLYVGPRLLSAEAMADDTDQGSRAESRHEAGPGVAPRGSARVGTGVSRRRRMLIVGALSIATIALELIPSEWASIRLTDDLAASGGVAGLAFVAVTVGMVVGRFAGDTLTQRLGGERLSRLAASLSIVGIVIGGAGPSQPLAIVGMGLAGLGASVLFPRLYDQAARSPDRPEAALGALTAGTRVGAFTVPVSVGALAATDTVSVGAAMIIVAALPAVALIGATFRSR